MQTCLPRQKKKFFKYEIVTGSSVCYGLRKYDIIDDVHTCNYGWQTSLLPVIPATVLISAT